MKLLTVIFVVILLTSNSYSFSQSIAINEVMASNATTIADEDGDYEDWIELYNFGTEPINLEGYGLSDSYSNPFKWVFPSITLEPGEYFLIWASGKNRVNPETELHTNYSISAAGEEVLLTHPDGNMVDELVPTNIPTDFSYGKYPNGTGEWRYFIETTPGEANIGPGYEFLLSPPHFSHPDGIYQDAFQLELTTSHEGAQIFYTLDGSEPNQSSTLYVSPITIASRIGEPNDISMIPTNNNPEPGPPYYEGWQPPLGEVFKINVVRARVVHPDAPLGGVVTYSYLVDTDGSNRYSLPFFSLATHRDNFFDHEIGIYVHGSGEYPNYFNSGYEWERPANLILFEKGGVLGFKEDIGVRLHGNTTRSRPRKSLRINARSEYGNSWINYPLFPDKSTDMYKRFILRNSGNDWDWSVFRDAFIQYLAKDFNVETQYYRPAILFINGEYWGINNVRDRYNQHYILARYGLEEHEFTAMENNSLFKFGNPAGVDHYNSMRSYINGNNMSQGEHYNHVKTLMDIESFIDFQLTHIFSMNTDWPGNNVIYWRKLTDYNPHEPSGLDGRWRWFILDTDFGFGLPFFYVPGVNEGPAHNTLAFATEPNGNDWPNPPWSTFLLRKLLENQEFKHQFINRYCDLLNTTFSGQHVVHVIDSIADLLEPEMQEHINRWRRPTSMAEWHDNVDVMRSFAHQRPSYQFQHMRQMFGLSNQQKVLLDVSNPLYGFIRINSISLKSSTMGVSKYPYPWEGEYLAGVPIELEALPFPGYQFSHWEGDFISTDAIIQVDPTSHVNLKAVFNKTDDSQLVHFWFFGNNLPNDTPLEYINSTYGLIEGARIDYHSALAGYPFTSSHPNWRKASMERRNRPTSINYRPEANNGIAFNDANMRGVQVKQPFTGDGGENTMFFSIPTTGFEDILFRFAAMDEDAANGLLIDYSIASGEPHWITEGLSTSSLNLASSYQLFELEFSNVEGVNNNPHFKVRIRFDGDDMSINDGDRVTFNNFSVDGFSLMAHTISASSGANGSIFPYGTIGVYEADSKDFTIVPDSGYKILDVELDGESVLHDVEINEHGVGQFLLDNVTQNHTLLATFSQATSLQINNQAPRVLIYPNPVGELLQVECDHTIEKVEVFNLVGNLVYSANTLSNSLSINVSNFSMGVYLVRVYTKHGVFGGRFIVN